MGSLSWITTLGLCIATTTTVAVGTPNSHWVIKNYPSFDGNLRLADDGLTRRRALLNCRGGGRAGCGGANDLSVARKWAARAWGGVGGRKSPDASVVATATSSISTEIVPRGGGSTTTPTKDEVTRKAYRSAVLKTCLLFFCAGAFGLGTIVVKGQQAGLEFFAGYIVEQSLSVDNLFIFIMLFDYFKVPAEFQSRVLNWGIIGAMSMRAIMIVVGVAAIQRFRWVMLFFAGILVVSSVNLLMEKGEEDHDSSQLENNTVLRIAKWMCDSTDYYDGEKFFTMVDGVKKATPLLLCLICIELTDFVFAVDSIPAVLGISQDTFIVYASNVFAICAMRSIYTLVSHAISDLPYLKPAVALVLGFVGAKMFLEFFHHEVGIGVSLGVVSGILTVGAVASIISNRRRDAALAGAGSRNDGLTFKPQAAGGGEGTAPLLASGLADPLTDFQKEPLKDEHAAGEEGVEGTMAQTEDLAADLMKTAGGATSDASESLTSKLEEGVAAAEDSVREFGTLAQGAAERSTEGAEELGRDVAESASSIVESANRDGEEAASDAVAAIVEAGEQAQAAVSDAIDGFKAVVEEKAEDIAPVEEERKGTGATAGRLTEEMADKRRQDAGDRV